jgi:hypothetical protein
VKSYVLYKDWSLTISQFIKNGTLPHAEAGMLLEAILDYQLQGNEKPDLPVHLLFLFNPLVDQFRRDEEKYFEKVERNKKNGLKGGRPKTESEPLAIAKVAKPAKVAKESSLFDDFYSLYPKKQGKEQAIKAYQKALKKTTHEIIMAGVKNYKAQIASKNTEMQYIKQPATWLNAGCWDDDYGSTTSTTPSTNAYDALLAKIESVMDQEGNFEHGNELCNIHNIEKFISADDNGVRVYYTDARGYTNPKYFTIEAITKIGAYC